LYFGDRVTVLNDFIYQTGGSIPFEPLNCWKPHQNIDSFQNTLKWGGEKNEKWEDDEKEQKEQNEPKNLQHGFHIF
jgi:hypothetical protein